MASNLLGVKPLYEPKLIYWTLRSKLLKTQKSFKNYLERLINHDLELWQQIIMFYNSSFGYTGELGPEGAY